MRALGFEIKKTEVLKLLKENDKDGRGLMEFDDFSRISMPPPIDTDLLSERGSDAKDHGT